MPEHQLKIKVGIPGQEETVKVPIKRAETLEQAINWIKDRGYDEYITEQLIVKIKKYPVNTWTKFKEDISLHVQKINELKKQK